MACPATKTMLAMKDTSAPDMTIKVTGYQWKWGYDYLQEGFGFYSTLATPLAQIEGREPQGRELPARGRQSAGRARRQEDPRAHHRQRRDPFLVGAGVRRQAGCDSRLRARHVVPRRKVGHLPRPVRRAVRQGARLHADRRRGEVEGRLREMGRRAEAEARRGGRTIRTRSGTSKELVARGEKVYNANCAACHQPTGKGTPRSAFPALAGSKIVTGPKAAQIDIVLNGQTDGVVQGADRRQDAVVEPAFRHRHRGGRSPTTRNSWGNKAGENVVQPAEVKARAQVRRNR